MGSDAQLLIGLAGKFPALDIAAIFFAEYVGYIVLLIFLAALLLRTDLRGRLYAMAFSVLSILLSWGVIKASINYAFYRPRPFVAYNITPLFQHEADSSFPSGHATIFFTVATLIFLIFGKRWGVWAYVIATLIGVARVYGGVHYPLDIAAGALIGILSPLIIRLFLPARLAEQTATEEVSPETSQRA